MLKKIISDGCPGAGIAALDAAIKLDLRHGGTTPENLGSEGAALERFDLQEMPRTRKQCTERNILDSDGTLIFFRGPLGGNATVSRDYARKHRRPWLHIDLNASGKFDAALKIGTWIKAQNIGVLHVTGSDAAMVKNESGVIQEIIESAYHLCFVNPPEETAAPPKNAFIIPQTVEEAVHLLDSYMSLRDKVTVANFTADELLTLHLSLGSYISNSFKLWLGNDALLESCRLKANKNKRITPDEAATVIIYELWKTLRKTHKLRLIKGNG